jgi:hypothetical protein
LQRRVVGDEHPTTIASAESLGAFLAAHGQHAEAERMYRAAHAAQVKPALL